MTEKTKPDPTPREVTELRTIKSYAFVTRHGRTLVLDLYTFPGNIKRIIIPWAAGEPVVDSMVQLIRTETESEAQLRMHSELFAEMHVERNAEMFSTPEGEGAVTVKPARGEP